MFTLQEVKSLMLIFDLLKERKRICIGKHLTRLVILANLDIFQNYRWDRAVKLTVKDEKAISP